MTPERRVLGWTWDERNGWINGNDAALYTEIALIDEIERLRSCLEPLARKAFTAGYQRAVYNENPVNEPHAPGETIAVRRLLEEIA